MPNKLILTEIKITYFLRLLRRAGLEMLKCYHTTELEPKFMWFKWFKCLPLTLLPFTGKNNAHNLWIFQWSSNRMISW